MAGRRFPRRAVLVLQVAVIAAIGYFLVLPQLHVSTTHWGLLLRINSFWLFLGLTAELVSLFVYALGTRLSLPAMHRPGLWRVVRIDLASIMIAHVTPAGGAAGTAASLGLFRRSGVPLAEASSAKLIQGLAAVLSLVALLFGSLVIATTENHLSTTFISSCVAAAFVTLLMTGLIVGIQRDRDRLARVADRLFTRVRAKWAGGGTNLILTIGGRLDELSGDRRRWQRLGLLMLANWVFDATALWCAVSVFGHSVSGLDIVVPFCISSALKWVPITPGGLGIVEATLIPLLVVFGVTHSTAVLGVITWRLLSFWLPILLGCLAFWSLRVRRTRGEPAAV